MTDVTLTGIWKNNFRFQLDFMRQLTLSDALPLRDLMCLFLGLMVCGLPERRAQNMVVCKVEAQKRGSEKD